MTTTTDYRDVTTNDALRNELCAWLEANGIDPDLVPAEERPTLTEDMQRSFPRHADMVLDIRMWERAEHGGMLLNNLRTAPIERMHTVPITVPPPPNVRAWLDSRCPTCRR